MQRKGFFLFYSFNYLKFFDDVVRKFRENEAALIPTVYRNQTEIEQNVRKSLAEVYEDKLSNAQKEDKQQEKVFLVFIFEGYYEIFIFYIRLLLNWIHKQLRFKRI